VGAGRRANRLHTPARVAYSGQVVSRKIVMAGLLSFALAGSLFSAGDAAAKGHQDNPDHLLAPGGVIAVAERAPERPTHPDALLAPSGMASFTERLAVPVAPTHPDGLMEPTDALRPHHHRASR
jgi:hypothetical protein